MQAVAGIITALNKAGKQRPLPRIKTRVPYYRTTLLVFVNF